MIDAGAGPLAEAGAVAVDLAIDAVGGESPPLLAALSGQRHTAVADGHGRQDISAARLALASPSCTS